MNILARLDTLGYEFQIMLHIVSVAAWVGSIIALTLGAQNALKGGAPAIASFATLAKTLNMKVKSAAFVLLFISGFGLVFGSRPEGADEMFWSMGDPFVSMGMAAVIVGGAIGGMIHAPAARDLEVAANAGKLDEAKKLMGKMSLGNGIEIVLVLIALFMMVTARQG